MLALHTTTAAIRCPLNQSSTTLQVTDVKVTDVGHSILAPGGLQQLCSMRRIATHGFNKVLLKVVCWGDVPLC